MWPLLLILHLIGTTGFNLRLRLSLVAKLDPILLATIMQTGIAVPMLLPLLLHLPNGQFFTQASGGYFAACVIFTIGLQFSNAKALQYLEASVFSILYNLRIPMVTVAGIIFLHERFLWLRVLGGMLIFSAIFIVQQKGRRSLAAKGTEWALLSVLSITVLNVSEKTLATSVGFWRYFPLVSVVTAVIMWSYVLRVQRVDFKILKRGDMLQLMAFRAASAYGFSGALATGAIISVANYIAGMSVFLTTGFGVVLLGERDHLQRKLIACGVAFIGLTIILVGSIV